MSLSLVIEARRQNILTSYYDTDFRAILAIARGDVNNSGYLSVSDLTYLVSYLYKGGPPPFPDVLLADCNCTGTVNVSDLDYLVSYFFKGGDPPETPCYEY